MCVDVNNKNDKNDTVEIMKVPRKNKDFIS